MMNRRVSGIGFALPLTLAAGLMTAAAWAAEDRPRVGGVSKLEREATATYEADIRRLAVKDAVYFQDLLETADRARLAVTLEDGTMLTLGEKASLRIDEFVYEPEDRTGSLSLSVLEGAFLFVGGKTEDSEDSDVEINTSVGTLGVRGTIVWGGRIDDAYGVLVAKGAVTVRNAAGEVDLGPGEGTMIEAMDTAPSAPKVWPREKVQRALQTISFQEN